MKVVRSVPENMKFLADPTGRVIIEFYANTKAEVLDFPSIPFLTLHLAFLVEDPEKTAEKLLVAGATIAEPYKKTPAGDRMIMLRDPFGISIQFIKRRSSMF